MTLDLPEPPSVNRMWRRGGNRTYLSKAGREFKAAVAMICRAKKVRPLYGPVAVEITWRRKRRDGDLDNRAKLALDALNGLAYEDDSQIVELHAYRRDDKANPGVTITVREAA